MSMRPVSMAICDLLQFKALFVCKVAAISDALPS